jgi:hypothetical protein
MNNHQPSDPDPGPRFDGQVFRITRQQLLADGVLLDISAIAREAALVFPTAITAGLWAAYGDARTAEGSPRFALVLCWMLRFAARGLVPVRRFKDPFSETLYFRLFVQERATGQFRLAEVKAVCDPGDNLELVITLLLPEED